MERDWTGEYVTPDDVTFCSLIRGYGSQTENFRWNEILRILERMEKEFSLKRTISLHIFSITALCDCAAFSCLQYSVRDLCGTKRYRSGRRVYRSDGKGEYYA